MRQLLVAFVLLLAAQAGGPPPATAAELITLNLPESVIAEAAEAILPLRLDAHSPSLEGEITVIDISELQLRDNHLACRLHLAGNQLAVLTELAGHEIRLKMGAVEVDFTTDAAIRFDPARQILYIRPVVKDLAQSGPNAKADIGQALVALLNGREFPISLQKLEPLIARAGAKTITINTTIANIEAKPRAIRLSLQPAVAVHQ